MYNMHTHKELEKAVIRSQHTQRNWNLSKNIPKDDVDVMLHAVTNCPSKQNIAFYKVHFIQDRDVIEEVHEHTEGFSTKRKKGDPVGFETNPQTLANLLVLFENYDFTEDLSDDMHRNAATLSFIKTGKWDEKKLKELDRDRQVAVGIAAGYLNLTASLLGYRTGCCQCFDAKAIKQIVVFDEKPLLLMGIGFPQMGVDRKKHHIRDFVFNSKKKQPIKYKIWD